MMTFLGHVTPQRRPDYRMSCWQCDVSWMGHEGSRCWFCDRTGMKGPRPTIYPKVNR